MMNDGRRWLIVLPLFLGSILWIVPNGWSQGRSSSTEAPSSQSDQQPVEETPASSQEIPPPLNEAPPSAPEALSVPTPEAPTGSRKYTVKKGDTLWGISNAYLQDSFLWPKLWKSNQYIFNPDLIYPGNIIELPGEETAEQEFPESETARQTTLPEFAPPPPAPPPGMVEEQAPIAVEAERPEETPPMPKKLDQTLLATSGYILTGQRAVGIIVGARDGRELIGQNETAYLLPQKGSHPQVGDRYTVYRVERKVYHPKTGKFMGDLIRILGLAEVTGADPRDKTMSANVLVSYDSIQTGDSLMPIPPQEESAGEAVPSTSSQNPLTGVIVEVKENRISQSQFDVVFLDRGRQDGVRSGDRFAIIREGDKTSIFSPGDGVRLPRRIIGEVQVVAAQDGTSIAKVTQSTEVILKGDLFETHSEP